MLLSWFSSLLLYISVHFLTFLEPVIRQFQILDKKLTNMPLSLFTNIVIEIIRHLGSVIFQAHGYAAIRLHKLVTAFFVTFVSCLEPVIPQSHNRDHHKRMPPISHSFIIVQNMKEVQFSTATSLQRFLAFMLEFLGRKLVLNPSRCQLFSMLPIHDYTHRTLQSYHIPTTIYPHPRIHLTISFLSASVNLSVPNHTKSILFMNPTIHSS